MQEPTAFSLSSNETSNEAELERNLVNGYDPLFIGLMAIVAIIAGVIFRIGLKRVPLPYTLWCLIFGLLLGEIFYKHNADPLGDSIQQWIELEAEVILFLFLPPLIFESAASLDFHTFRWSFWQSLTLAIPGVLISASLTALVGFYVFPYDWTISMAFTLGSILAATDPVAVVALLKDIGAPRTLATIVEGESLLNDGIAFVLFSFFRTEIQADTAAQSVGDFFWDFIYKGGVSALMGYVLGNLSTFVIGLIFHDAVSIVAISLVGSYGIFYIVEGIEGSGVLGVVTYGLAFAAHKIGYIDSSGSHAFHTFWETLGFIANTVVFVYSGIVICNFGLHGDSIRGNDYAYLLLLYVLLMLIRALAIVLLSPLLSRLGYGFNAKQGVLLTWGGLRGAVGLILGLFILRDPLVDTVDGERIMFYVAGIVTLTLVVNGPSTAKLVSYLQIDRRPAAAKVFFQNAVLRTKDRLNLQVSAARRDIYNQGVDWEAVWQWLPILSREMRSEAIMKSGGKLTLKSIRSTSRYFNQTEMSYFDASPEQVQLTLVQDARHRFLNLVKAAYNAEFEHDALESRPAFQILVNAASAAQDQPATKDLEWSVVLSHGTCLHYYRWLAWFPALKHLLVDYRLQLGYELAAVFIKTHLAVEASFAELIGNELICASVLEESHDQVIQAQTVLDDMDTNFADITGAFKTHTAAQALIRDTFLFANDLYERGEIDDKEYDSLIKGINRSRSAFFFDRFGITKPLERLSTLRNCVLFEGLDADTVETIVALFHEKEYLPSEVLAVEGKAAAGLFVITNGKVCMSKSTKNPNASGYDSMMLRTCTAGALVGDKACLSSGLSRWTYTCASNVRGYFLKAATFQKLLQDHEGKRFEKNVYVNAGVFILQMFRIVETGTGYAPKMLDLLMNHAILLRPDNGVDEQGMLPRTMAAAVVQEDNNDNEEEEELHTYNDDESVAPPDEDTTTTSTSLSSSSSPPLTTLPSQNFDEMMVQGGTGILFRGNALCLGDVSEGFRADPSNPEETGWISAINMVRFEEDSWVFRHNAVVVWLPNEVVDHIETMVSLMDPPFPLSPRQRLESRRNSRRSTRSRSKTHSQLLYNPSISSPLATSSRVSSLRRTPSRRDHAYSIEGLVSSSSPTPQPATTGHQKSTEELIAPQSPRQTLRRGETMGSTTSRTSRYSESNNQVGAVDFNHPYLGISDVMRRAQSFRTQESTEYNPQAPISVMVMNGEEDSNPNPNVNPNANPNPNPRGVGAASASSGGAAVLGDGYQAIETPTVGTTRTISD